MTPLEMTWAAFGVCYVVTLLWGYGRQEARSSYNRGVSDALAEVAAMRLENFDKEDDGPLRELYGRIQDLLPEG